MAIKLTEDLLTKEAEEFGKNLGSMDSTQIRKFYDEFKLLEKKVSIDLSEEKFKSEILPLIKFVKSKIAYNAGRNVDGKILVPKVFKEKMDEYIDRIQTKEDFKNFIMFYQATIGYFTYETKPKKQEPRKNTYNQNYSSRPQNKNKGR